MSSKASSANKTAIPTPEHAADAPTPVPASLREHPFVMAVLALAGAIAAVAKFPNSPVPDSLIGRIDLAQAALLTAASDLDQGVFPVSGVPASGPGESPDWIRQQFESLDAALKEKFEAIDARLDAALVPPPADEAAED